MQVLKQQTLAKKCIYLVRPTCQGPTFGLLRLTTPTFSPCRYGQLLELKRYLLIFGPTFFVQRTFDPSYFLRT